MKLPTVVAALVLSSPAIANDWYVDAVNGNDGNGGTSPTDAWRTVTHALGEIPSTGPDTIHLLPGLYEPALGEVFPLRGVGAWLGEPAVPRLPAAADSRFVPCSAVRLSG